jgi:hypothetical protein
MGLIMGFVFVERHPAVCAAARRWLAIRKAVVTALAVVLFAAVPALAQVIDRIDVSPGETEADLTIRFAQKIQYLRHGPQGEVKEFRVFVRLVDSAILEGDLVQETLNSPKTERVVGVTVAYPELRNAMLVTFSQATKYKVLPGKDGRSVVIRVPLLPAPAKQAIPSPPAVPAVSATPAATLPLPVPAPALALPAPAAPAPVLPARPIAPPPAADAVAAVQRTPEEMEAMARTYLDEAKAALVAGDKALAINRLNRVLGMPPTAQSEPAQALIGEAREANGEAFKARAEYELYLKQYPKGPGAARVRQRLAALKPEAAPAEKPRQRDPGPTGWTYSGSVSAYYYTGKSQVETLVPPPPGELTFGRETLSMVDQRSLITSVNLNARKRDADHDTRIVVRDTNNRNDLDPERSYNRLYSAYVEHTDRPRGYYLRLGRQNPNGIGVLDRFDGAQGGYNLNPDWRVNSVLGQAVEFGSSFDRKFVGASVDYMPQSGRPGGSLYVIEQRLDGFENRRALGTEVRYFDGKLSAFGNLDYDVLYRGVNIALLQGNYLDAAGNNYFFVIDHRRSPPYSLSTALVAAPGLGLKDMISAQGAEAVRDQAAALSAKSNLFSIGVTHPLGADWQVGADYRWSSISSTREVSARIPLAVVGTCLGTVDPADDTCVYTTPAQPGSGANHVVSLQAIGSNLLARGATGVANLSLILAQGYRGQAWGLNYALPIRDVWRIDGNLRYYRQSDDNGDRQYRVSPSVKLSYQWRSSLYLEAEVGEERSHVSGASRDDRVTRDYAYFGVRWDFR